MANRQAKRRAFGHAWSLVFDAPWLIAPAKLDEIVAFLALRRDGHEFTDDEIRARCGLFDDRGDDDEPAPYVNHDGVAVLAIQGTLLPRVGSIMRSSGVQSLEQMSQNFRAALADDGVRAILLQIDSPGGSTTATPEFADLIYSTRERKPIWAVNVGTMASAAYWIGTAASRVFASPSAMTGSIGVYMAHQDVSKAEEKSGRKTTLISAGTHKVDGNPYEPLSAQSRSTMQELVDTHYRNFVATVARNRGVSADKVAADFGQGKTFLAAEAFAVGMIDGVQTYEQTLAQMHALVKPKSSGAIVTSPGFPVFSAAGSSVRPVTLSGGSPVNAKIKAALFARGLIVAASVADVTDDQATAAMNGFFAGRGTTPPADENALIAAIFGAAPVAATPPTQTTVQPLAVGGIGAAESDRIAQAARTAERHRQDDLRARGTMLGVSAAVIQAAIDSESTVEAAVMAWTRDLSQTNTPVVRPNTTIQAGEASLDVLAAAGTDLLLMRAATVMDPRQLQQGTLLLDAEGRPRRPHAATAGMQHMSMFDIARACVLASGTRVEHMQREDIARAFLAMGPRDVTSLASLGAPQANGPSYNTAGMYPNLLSAVANKIIDVMLTPIVGPYREYAKQLESVTDFHPRTIVRAAAGGELPELVENDKFPEMQFAEGANWIQVGQFGEKLGMTPTMIANNTVGSFFEFFPAQMSKMERTLNRLCLNVLASNPTLSDGIPLFDASRGNILSVANAAISVTNMDLARIKLRRMRNIGGDDDLNLTPSIALVPPERETESQQFFLPNLAVPTADTSVNVFKSTTRPYSDAMLTNVNDWYLLVDKMIAAAVVYMHMQGYEGGKRDTWYDPDYRTQWFSFEARFAAAANAPQGALKVEDNDD